MSANIYQMVDKDGNKQYPVTSTDAIGMSGGSGNLKDYLNKSTTEFNVSAFFPTGGTSGSNKYDLASAIGKVPAELRTAGLKVSFLNSSGKPESWKYQGGSWAVSNFIQESEGGNKILTWKTDAATTRKQVADSERKNGMLISYKPDGEDWVNEQYIGTSFTDTEWVKDSNWNKIPGKSEMKELTENIYNLEENLNGGKDVSRLFAVNNYTINSDGSVSGSGAIMAFDVSFLNGHVLIKRDSKVKGYQFAFYNVITNAGYGLSIFNSSSLIGNVGDYFDGESSLLKKVGIPEGAKTLIVKTLNNTDDTISIINIEDDSRIDSISEEFEGIKASLYPSDEESANLLIGIKSLVIIDPNSGLVTSPGGTMGSVYRYNISKLVGKKILLKRDADDSASFASLQYAIYNTDEIDNLTTDNVIYASKQRAIYQLSDELTIPENSQQLCVFIRTKQTVELYVYDEKNSVESVKEELAEVMTKVTKSTDITSEVTYKFRNDHRINPFTGLLESTGGGGGIQIFRIDGYVGKTLRIERAAASDTNSAQWAIYDIDVSTISITSINPENVLALSENRSTYELNEDVLIPEGSKYVAVYGRQGSFTITIKNVETLINAIPNINPTARPSYDGWSLPSGTGGTSPDHYDNFYVINDGKSLKYGGANLIFKRAMVSFGDSLQDGGQHLKNLAVLAGITYKIYAAGGRASTPTPSQWNSNTGKFLSMQDLVLKCINENETVDLISFENVNDHARLYSPEGKGSISDKPFMLSQYINYENGYTSAQQAKEGFTQNFSSIIGSASFKKGSIAAIKYQTKSYNLTLSGTTSNGIFKINIGSDSYTMEVTSGMSLEELATYIATFEFKGYAVAATGNVVTLTLQDGTEDNKPTISDNSSNVAIAVEESTNTSFVFYYFIGYLSSEWNQVEKWTNTSPSLYAIYKGIFEALFTAYPKALIYFHQPPMAMAGGVKTYEDGSTDVYTSMTSGYQNIIDELSKVQEDIANLYNFRCINVYKESNINFINAKAGEFYYSDPIHYGLETMRRSAEIVYRHLK